MIKKRLEPLYLKLFPPTLIKNLNNELLGCNKVLDVGCGPNSLLKSINVPYSIGIDLFEPYINKSKENNIHNKYFLIDIRKAKFEPNEFDAVICIDVIEHLTKKEVYNLIKKMEKWANKKIIIYTPNEYVFQEEYDGNPLQKHKSGWNTQKLENLGFQVYGINGWKLLRGYKGSIKYKPYLLWQLFSDSTQKLTYRYPKFASGLLAIKRKSSSV